DQAIARIIRVRAHSAFTNTRDKLIKIFVHAAVEKGPLTLPKDGGFLNGAKGYSKNRSVIDVYILRTSEEKEHRNTQIYRLMKEVAVDCAINYRRNVLPNDVSKSRECDYMEECNYTCDTMAPTATDEDVWSYSIDQDELDVSTYNLFYGSNDVKK